MGKRALTSSGLIGPQVLVLFLGTAITLISYSLAVSLFNVCIVAIGPPDSSTSNLSRFLMPVPLRRRSVISLKIHSAISSGV